MASSPDIHRQVTLIDVAKEAGVSRATASLVIRESPLVSSETRKKVEAAIEKLGYVRNLTAARLRAGQSRVVGLVIPNLANPFFSRLLAGIEEILDQAGLAVLLANSHDDLGRQHDVLRRMREHGVNGVIVCPAAGTQQNWLSDNALGPMPVVQLLRYVTDQLDYVGVDYGLGVRQAVNYLVGLGHSQIVFAVHGAMHSAYRERVDGFSAAMDEHSLKGNSLLAMPMRLTDIPAATKSIFEFNLDCTATLCFNDVIAIGLSAGLHDLGITIGRDHSLVGFDDVHNGEIIRPPITSVATHPTEIGRMAGRRMLERLQQPAETARRVVLKPELMIRESCTAAPALKGNPQSGQ
ncbi:MULTISPECIES: LacI family DNA-binding transcriptional regulator [unclassified Rhizobium]|uniref:LacI family DNA-binding transcriptional regulator n=1 Tax=unclassified Rhizobium TaxID=2613769 RepID=UPI001ADA4CFA|nr:MULTISPECIES: LacI family DNA-binding transcriptional regulator [unclassified Rhizobium]MBO9123844.1 LacI family DNA-binding transcriptional regulator [Rhizobium sp. 16-488-2b]MBO9174376.1 LacI family DNA-binding transcriptional regulator [Rhizobium sp. 16-488-2a]